jgi:hypothetical protein
MKVDAKDVEIGDVKVGQHPGIQLITGPFHFHTGTKTFPDATRANGA